MIYAALLLLPAAGLPPPPTLTRKHFAGYEWEVGGKWGGTFRLYKNGAYEHGYPGTIIRGSWGFEGGVLTVWDSNCPDYPWVNTRYDMPLAPDGPNWWLERQLVGPCVGCPGRVILRNPRRLKP